MRMLIKGLSMTLAVSLALMFTPVSISTYALDSDAPLTTAAQIKTAVDKMTAGDTATVDKIAAAVRALTTTEKRRLSQTTIRRLDGAYAKNHAYTQALTIKEGTVTSNRISKSGASVDGATVAAGGSASFELWQDKPSSSSVYLEFSIECNTALNAPVIYYFNRPSNINTSYDYYLKDANGTRIDAYISSSSFSFMAPRPTGVFRVYRGSKNTNSGGGNNNDDPYEVTVFWQDVIDTIHSTRSGERVRVNVGTRTTVPADVLRELRGRSISLALRPNSGSTVTIYGKDLDKIPTNRDYYTLSTLRNLYSTAASSSSRPASSRPYVPPEVAPTPTPLPPPPSITPTYPTPAPSVTPPAAVITPTPAPSSSSSSSAPELSSSSEEELPLPDVEISAQEDNVPASEQEGAEEVAVKPEEARSFLLISVLIMLASAAGGALLTLLLCGRRRKIP